MYIRLRLEKMGLCVRASLLCIFQSVFDKPEGLGIKYFPDAAIHVDTLIPKIKPDGSITPLIFDEAVT